MSGPPEDHPERFDWFSERAAVIGMLNNADWYPDMIQELWDRPDLYAQGELYDPSGVEDEHLYALVRHAIAFGIEYEREYPTGGDWRTEFAEVADNCNTGSSPEEADR